MKSLKKVVAIFAFVAIVALPFILTGCADTPENRAAGRQAGLFLGNVIAGALENQYAPNPYYGLVPVVAPVYVESDNDGFVVEDDGDYLIVNAWYGGEFQQRRIIRSEYNVYHERFSNARGRHHMAGPRQHYNGGGQRNYQNQRGGYRGAPTGRSGPQQQFQQHNNNGGNQKSSGKSRGKKDERH
ncbi:MAG: hypothetical protein WCF92_00820 [bacterium]